MLLESLEILNFRNLNGKISFSNGLNIFAGDNGHGKTNWLEAIYLCGLTKSFKTPKLTDAIRFGESLAVVSGMVRESPEITRKLQVAIEGNTKNLSINDKKETVQRYLGQMHVVVFNADELEMIRGVPDARRRFLDGGIVSLHPPFVQTFTDYNRVVRQKNSLLANARDSDYSLDKASALLAPWNEQLAMLATRIHRARLRFVERINEVLEKKLFGREELTIRYLSSLEDKGDLADYQALITDRLALRVQAELAAGHALIGTHRDDLAVSFDGHDIRRFGSSGQQRSALLLLQLAGIAVFHATRGEYPLYMLDDIDAELDYRRIGQLIDYLDGKTQTFVTTSKESFVERFGTGACIFDVREGVAERR